MLSSCTYKTTGWMILLVAFCFQSVGQKIENVKATLSGDYIVVDYDLSDAPASAAFIIELFSSHNNFSTPVVSVSGDVGPNVTAGRSKAIRWFAKNDLVNYLGEIVVEVRARAVVTIERFSFKNPDGDRVKKGNTLLLGWTGGRKEERIELQLFKDGQPLNALASGISNSGSFKWEVPSKSKTGKYQIKLMGESGEVMSGVFTIKSRLPIIVKVLPVLVVGAGIYMLSSSGEETGGGSSGSTDLPQPPEPN